MIEQMIKDQPQRDRALDAKTSFIVQAPAGSGKTELLTLRYLKLLSKCNSPESVLAITFTRKAAAEMRNRVIEMLRWGKQLKNLSQGEDQQGIKNPVDTPLRKTQLSIVTEALKTNEKYNWNLDRNPLRLKIQTIDSFCASLARQLPIASQLGGQPNVTSEVDHCFHDAIMQTLADRNKSKRISSPIQILMQTLDNRDDRAYQTLYEMLQNRDQWLQTVLTIRNERDFAQGFLQTSSKEVFEEAVTQFQTSVALVEQDMLKILRYSASKLNLEIDGLQQSSSLNELFRINPDNPKPWKQLRSIFLNQSGHWRQKLDPNAGFPGITTLKGKSKDLAKPIYKLVKETTKALREQADNEKIREQFIRLSLLPEQKSESEWNLLSAVVEILYRLNRNLMLAFSKFGVVDHSQIQSAAIMALGDSESPSELALSLDYKLQHILVDEFQDTSQSQLTLLKRLTEGWLPEDGRTLFMVGDPMQSCYRFRNANVGIFLNVCHNGLGDIDLENLVLNTNFRSQPKLVNSINSIFSNSFPKYSDSICGAVPYSPSFAAQTQASNESVRADWFTYQTTQEKYDSKIAEAQLIASRIKSLNSAHPQQSIAILVKARSILPPILKILRQEKIQWVATDIDKVENLSSVNDAMSLIKSVLNPADKLSWLSILRAPWCGLQSHDLLAIESADFSQILWEKLKKIELIDDLTDDAKKRLIPFIGIMEFIMVRRFETPVRELIETCWTLLGGGRLYALEIEAESVAWLFDELEVAETGGILEDIVAFEKKIWGNFAPSSQQKHSFSPESVSPVQILTIFKAKGLEYDHVFLPGLNKKEPSDAQKLVSWHEFVNKKNEPRLLLSLITHPTKKKKEENNTNNLIKFEEKIKKELEFNRILYIAVTRAKLSVSLSGAFLTRQQDVIEPIKNSILNVIWPSIKDYSLLVPTVHYPNQPLLNLKNEYAQRERTTKILRYKAPISFNNDELFNLTKNLLKHPSNEHFNPKIVESYNETVSQEREFRAAIGTLLHEFFESHATVKPALPLKLRLKKIEGYWRRTLEKETINTPMVDTNIELMKKLTIQTLTGNNAWIFDPSLKDSSNEITITTKEKIFSTENSAWFERNYIVDRSFIDENEVRWVIDYKTSLKPEDQSEKSFIANLETAHSPQLQKYAQLFSDFEDRSIKKAIFAISLNKLILLK